MLYKAFNDGYFAWQKESINLHLTQLVQSIIFETTNQQIVMKQIVLEMEIKLKPKPNLNSLF